MTDFSFKSPTTKEAIINGKDKTALVDADFIKYKVTYRISQNVSNSLDGDEREAEITTIVDEVIAQYIYVANAFSYLFCFSDKTKNLFRFNMACEKQYKGGRKKPPLYEKFFEDMAFIDEYIQATTTNIKIDGLEADDLVSMFQDNDTFIISEDKDLNQVPGYHYDMKNDEFYYIDEKEAFKLLMRQMIVGDNSSDNIPGIKGRGPSYWDKHIRFKDNPDKLVREIFEEYLMEYGIREGLDAFVENYNLLSMQLKRGDYIKEKFKTYFDHMKILKKEK